MKRNERQAAAREAEIQRRVVAIAAALAAGGPAAAAAMELDEDDALPREVLAVAALEKAFHESEVPRAGKRGRPSKGGKARKSRADARHRAAKDAHSAEELDLDGEGGSTAAEGGAYAYSGKTKPQLQKLCKERVLVHSTGNKGDLIKRLIDHNNGIVTAAGRKRKAAAPPSAANDDDEVEGEEGEGEEEEAGDNDEPEEPEDCEDSSEEESDSEEEEEEDTLKEEKLCAWL